MSFFFFFFLNQQFITRGAEADHGSYFCNYVHDKRANMTGKEEKENKKKKRKKKGKRRKGTN